MLDVAGRRICAFPEAVGDITQSKLLLTTAGDPAAKAKTAAVERCNEDESMRCLAEWDPDAGGAHDFASLVESHGTGLLADPHASSLVAHGSAVVVGRDDGAGPTEPPRGRCPQREVTTLAPCGGASADVNDHEPAHSDKDETEAGEVMDKAASGHVDDVDVLHACEAAGADVDVEQAVSEDMDLDQAEGSGLRVSRLMWQLPTPPLMILQLRIPCRLEIRSATMFTSSRLRVGRVQMRAHRML